MFIQLQWSIVFVLVCFAPYNVWRQELPTVQIGLSENEIAANFDEYTNGIGTSESLWNARIRYRALMKHK